MVEATNYAFLAILICLQYLGIEHNSYEMTLEYSKIENQVRPKATIVLTKNIEKENEWNTVLKERGVKVPMNVVKDSVTIYERDMANTTTFDEIDFDRLLIQQDTIFNKSKEAVATIIKNKKTIEFKILDNWAYEQITMKIKE